jgi:intracellular septation protein A
MLLRNLLGDLAAGLLFLAVLFITNDIYKATTAGVILGLIQIGWSRIKTGKIEPMQWLGSGLTLVMGGATILFRDPRFVMFKPTVAFTCIGLVMLKPGWMSRYLPQTTATDANTAYALRRFVRAVGILYAVGTLGIAVLNALFAIYASQRAWALFNAAGPTVVYSILGSVLYVGGKRIKRKTGWSGLATDRNESSSASRMRVP